MLCSVSQGDTGSNEPYAQGYVENEAIIFSIPRNGDDSGRVGACLGLGGFGSIASRRAADAISALPADVKFFEEKVRPLLEANCLKCHGATEKVKAGFHLTSREAILKGGELGPAIASDDPRASLLIKAINYGGELKMPPKGEDAAGARSRS